MSVFLTLRGSTYRWIFLLFWFALPWIVTFGLQLYGESVPQSVRRTTMDSTAGYSFLACAFGGMVLIFLPKERQLPRFLIGFLTAFSFLIAFGWPHYLCGPEFVQSETERQQQASSGVEKQKASASEKKTGGSC
jgi:hypothetical protein